MKTFTKVYFFPLLFSLWIINSVHAQTWINYTTADGLASNFVYAAAIDAQGNKWFGTGGGVSKFDGVNWTNYTAANGLVNNTVNAIAIDAQSNKWFGTDGGVSKFDGVNWTNYTTTDGLISNLVNAMAIDAQGNKWFCTDGGVSKFDGTNWTSHTTVNAIQCIAIDFQGNIWFGTYGGGLLKFDGASWTTYTTVDGLGSNFVMCVTVDVQDDIWCTPHDAIHAPITKFDGTHWTYYTFPYSGGGHVDAIVTDINGNKWIGTDNNAFKFDDISWSDILNADINVICIDTIGNKWFGTAMDGVWELSDGGAGPLSSACIIKGSIFLDANGNGIFDNGEANLQGKIVEVLTDSTFSTTQSDGNFYICQDSGTYQIKCIPENYWQFTTDSIITVIVNDTSTYINNIDFGIKMNDLASDVSVDISGARARPSHDVKYWLTYKNEATVTKSGTVALKIDSLTSFVSSTPSPDSQNGNIITWNYANLVSLEQRQIQFYLHMPDVSHLGETLTTTAIINPITGDMAPLNNYDTLNQVLTGSYDPNDKSVDKGRLDQGYTLMGDELAYTIRFQNTGTDTAFTVQIRDTIDYNMDVASLRLISSSHNVRPDVKGKNIVTFIFDNIFLPDSNVNEPASSGFVKFAIKPKPGLAEYTQVKNKAYIYFDFNPAVVTNQVLNTYVGNPFSGIEAVVVDDQSMKLFPNPVSNYLFIQSEQPSEIKIMNIQGQIMKHAYSTEEQISIDVSGFPSGLYFVMVKTEDKISVKKFIKE